MTKFVVPHQGLGTVRALPARPKEPLLIDASLLPTTLHPNHGGFDVVAEGAVLAHVTAADAAEYPELSWLLEQGLTPEVTARVTDGQVELLLPRPGLCLPANQPPAQPWVFLGAGGPHEVELIAAAEQTEPKHLLATVEFDDAGEVVVAVDGKVVGELNADVSSALTPTLRLLEERGLTAVARVYQTSTGLCVNAGPLDAELERGEIPVVSPVPPLEMDSLHKTRPAQSTFFANDDAKAAALAADTEQMPAVTPRERRSRRLSGPVVGTAAAAAALALTAAGALVINTSWDREDDSASAYVQTVTSQQADETEASTEASTEHTTETTAPTSEATTTPSEPAPDEDEAPANVGEAGAPPAQQAPVQQAPQPVPIRQVPVPQAPAPQPVQQAPAPAPQPAPAPAPAPRQQESHPFEYSIGGLQVRSNTRLDQPLYEVE